MDKTLTTPRSFWLTLFLVTIVVNLVMIRSVYLRLVELEADLLRSAWSGVMVLCFLIALCCAWLMVRIAGGNPPRFFPRPDQTRPDGWFLRAVGAVVFLGIVYLIPYAKFALQIGQDIKKPVYDPVLMLLGYYWVCWWLILLAMTALKLAFRTNWQAGFVIALLLLGVTYEIFIRFNVVTTYPFSLGWSEGSRYYYASLLFSERLYGEVVPLSPYHASRYILQSVPFLIPGLGIFEHRLWQFLLWIGLTTGASAAIASRAIDPARKVLRILFAAWLFLFFLRVGVYYHLQIMVILTLLGVSGKHPWRSLLAVVAASLWAGISRVNWFVMPAMIAIAIYLLETPFPKSGFPSVRQRVGYFSRPILWSVAGILSALAAQTAYVFFSGNAGNAKAFTSSFTSDLLWYRLLPNDGFLLGVVPGILFVSGPLLAGLVIVAAGHWKALHPIRWSGLFVMIAGLFAGSMVVSVKIGGGGDLHNTDTYAALISVIAAYFIGDRVRADVEQDKGWEFLRPPIVVIAALIPALFLVPELYPRPKYQDGMNQSAHQQLVQAVEAEERGGPVLFISERQMVALGDVNVPLIPDYEVIILMEMAMSGNQNYLDRFYSDLRSHRFSAIVAGKQNLGIKESGVFYEENNAWNALVSPYILCYYEPVQTIDAELRSIQIFKPRLVSDCSL